MGFSCAQLDILEQMLADLTTFLNTTADRKLSSTFQTQNLATQQTPNSLPSSTLPTPQPITNQFPTSPTPPPPQYPNSFPSNISPYTPTTKPVWSYPATPPTPTHIANKFYTSPTPPNPNTTMSSLFINPPQTSQIEAPIDKIKIKIPITTTDPISSTPLLLHKNFEVDNHERAFVEDRGRLSATNQQDRGALQAETVLVVVAISANLPGRLSFDKTRKIARPAKFVKNLGPAVKRRGTNERTQRSYELKEGWSRLVGKRSCGRITSWSRRIWKTRIRPNRKDRRRLEVLHRRRRIDSERTWARIRRIAWSSGQETLAWSRRTAWGSGGGGKLRGGRNARWLRRLGYGPKLSRIERGLGRLCSERARTDYGWRFVSWSRRLGERRLLTGRRWGRDKEGHQWLRMEGNRGCYQKFRNKDVGEFFGDKDAVMDFMVSAISIQMKMNEEEWFWHFRLIGFHCKIGLMFGVNWANGLGFVYFISGLEIVIMGFGLFIWIIAWLICAPLIVQLDLLVRFWVMTISTIESWGQDSLKRGVMSRTQHGGMLLVIYFI